MKKICVISIFIFLTGLFAGLFFSTDLSSENRGHLSALLLIGISSPGFLKDLAASLLANFSLAALMLPALFSPFLCPLPLLLLCFKSFSLGFCSGLMHLGSVESPFMISLVKFLPQNLFFIPAFILLAAALFYASIMGRDQKNRRSRQWKHLKSMALFSMVLILAGCITEAVCHLIVL